MEEKEDQVKDAITVKKPIKRSGIGDVIYSIKPALIFENWFGIFRFSIIDDVLVKTNGKMKCVGIVILSMFIALFCGRLHFAIVMKKTGFFTEAMNAIPSIVVLIQYATCVITTAFFICEKTVRIFTSFANLDSLLNINMNKDFYENSHKKTIMCLIILIVSHVIFTIIYQVTDIEFEPYKIFDLALWIEQDLEIIVFCKMVYMLKNRLDVINDYLAKFVLEQENKNSVFTVDKNDVVYDRNFNFIGSTSVDNTKVGELATMYDVIGETSTLINDIFNFQIFMNLVSTFICIVITIWTSLYFFRTPKDISGQLITVIVWCISNVFIVAVMSFTCETLLSTRRQTRVLVNEIIMDYDLPKTMRIQAKVFMELIEAWPLRIFVYDMFSVDIKLMLKFISVATTYMIVIIQVSHFV